MHFDFQPTGLSYCFVFVLCHLT